MKLTKETLKRIIKEELENYTDLSEDLSNMSLKQLGKAKNEVAAVSGNAREFLRSLKRIKDLENAQYALDGTREVMKKFAEEVRSGSISVKTLKDVVEAAEADFKEYTRLQDAAYEAERKRGDSDN
mgnify:FL=1